MSIWENIIGTTANLFQIQKGGVKLKNSSGNLLVRNAADTANANLICNDLTANNATFTGLTASKFVVTDTNKMLSPASYTPENVGNKDVSNGYAGLTLFKINFRNVANTFTSFFTNSNTAARTYTFQDKSGTIAHLDDVTGGTTPNWISAGELIYYWGATTTNPFLTNFYRNQYYYRQIGAKNWEIALAFDKAAGGNNGDGDYLFSLPVGVPDFDMSLFFQLPYTGSVNASDIVFNRLVVPSSFGNFSHYNVTSTVCQAVIYDARRFRIIVHQWGAGIRAMGAGWYFAGGAFGGTFKMQFQSV